MAVKLYDINKISTLFKTGRKEAISKKCILNVMETVQHVKIKKTNIPVPAGVEDSQTMRANIGQQEVYVTFKVKPSETFRRDKKKMFTQMFPQISLIQAILGGVIKIRNYFQNFFL